MQGMKDKEKSIEVSVHPAGKFFHLKVAEGIFFATKLL